MPDAPVMAMTYLTSFQRDETSILSYAGKGRRPYVQQAGKTFYITTMLEANGAV